MKVLKALVVTLLLLIISFCAGAGCYELYCSLTKHKFSPPTYDLINSPAKYPAMVRLHLKERFYCSGTVIADNYILTAAHCFDSEKGIRVFNEFGVEAKDANIIGLSKDWRSDLAVIEGDFKEFNQAQLDTSPASVLFNLQMQGMGVPIIACGFPQGGEPFCNSLSGLVQYGFGIAGMGFLYPGMSGGPVLNVATGHVFAVNSAVLLSTGIIIMPTISLWADLGIPTK